VLAEELDTATLILPGPRILSDQQLHPGSLVHYRYGQFSSNRVFTDDGRFEERMVDPDGRVVIDERLAWFSPPAWASPPFPQESLAVAVRQKSVLLGGRFRTRTAIRPREQGGRLPGGG